MNRDDLDSLVSDLNAGTPRTGPADRHTTKLRSWLEAVVA